MPIHDDMKYKHLLKDYAAPVSDDGFTHELMAEIRAGISQDIRKARSQKRGWLAVSFLMGGSIAGLQLPALTGLLTDMSQALRGTISHIGTFGPLGLNGDSAAISLGATPFFGQPVWILAGFAAITLLMGMLWTDQASDLF